MYRTYKTEPPSFLIPQGWGFASLPSSQVRLLAVQWPHCESHWSSHEYQQRFDARKEQNNWGYGAWASLVVLLGLGCCVIDLDGKSSPQSVSEDPELVGWEGMDIRLVIHSIYMILLSTVSSVAELQQCPWGAYYSLHQWLETGDPVCSSEDTDNAWRHLWLSLGKRR